MVDQDNSFLNIYSSPDYRIWLLIIHAHDLVVRNREKELKTIGVSWVQSRVLHLLKNHNGPIIPAQIARNILREPHSVSTLLDRMEKSGLILQTKGHGAKNKIAVELLPKGEAILNQAQGLSSIGNIFSCFSDAEKSTMIENLTTLRDSAIKELNSTAQLYEIPD